MADEVLNDTDFPPGAPPDDAWFHWITPASVRGKTRADELPGSGGGGGGGEGGTYFNGATTPASAIVPAGTSGASKGMLFTPYMDIKVSALWAHIDPNSGGDTYMASLFESDAAGVLGSMVAQSASIAVGGTDAKPQRFSIDTTDLAEGQLYCLLITITSGSGSTTAKVMAMDGSAGNAAMSWNAPVNVTNSAVELADNAPAAADDASVTSGYFYVCWIEGYVAAPPTPTVRTIPTSTQWRVRFPNSSQDSGVGVGLSELKFLDSDMTTNLCTGGTPFADRSEGGSWALSEAFDGSTASNNGWYSAGNQAGAFNAYIGYTFATAVRPSGVSFCCLNGFPGTQPRTAVVEYYDATDAAWYPVLEVWPPTGANNVYNTYALPTTFTVPVNKGPWTGKNMLFLGDSITAANPGWVEAFKTETGCVIGGRLATGGWDAQDVLDAIQADTTLGSYDGVIVFVGTNDYGNGSGTPMGALGDDEADATFIGQLEQLCTEVYTDNKLIRLGFVTPLRRTDVTAANAQGKVLTDYRDAIIAVAEKYGCPVFNSSKQAGLNAVNTGTFLADGLHPGVGGYRVLGQRIARWWNGN